MSTTWLAPYRGIPLRYACRREALEPTLAARYLELGLDPSTRAWIDDAFDRPTAGLRLAARTAARALMGDYEANAMLDTHDMRVLGREQWVALLGDASTERWLDIGAGDGRVTREIAAVAKHVVTTETSPRMGKRLRERGFECHVVDVAVEPLPAPGAFDVVSALNVLDRTHKPYTLLERMRELLAPTGLLVIAVPLPLSPHVHVGAGTVDPDELLPIERGSFELAANTLATLVFPPLGLDVAAFSRVPYLSRGDSRVPVYVLDDAIFVLKRRA